MTISDQQAGFREHLVAQGRARKTVLGYVGMLDPFARFLDERGTPDLAGVTPEIVDAYATHLAGRSRTTQTARAHLRALKRFCEFLFETGRIPASPAAHLRDPREPGRRAAARTRPQAAAPAAMAVTPPPARPPRAPSPPPALALPPTAPPPRSQADDLLDTARQTDEIVVCHGERRYRVRGLLRNDSLHQLRVNVLVSVGEGDAEPAAFHIDTIDLYSARQRTTFVKAAARELRVPEEIAQHDLGRVLFTLEGVHAAAVREAAKSAEPTPPKLTPDEEAAALALLRDPRLIDRVVADLGRCGLVGEESNKLLAYLAVVSRKLDDPLAVVVQSSSAAGKSTLIDAVLGFVPPEDRVKASALTSQALYYMGAQGLRHKVLAIAEEAGARRASYALKLLQSERELTIASTEKDALTGKLTTRMCRVEGPVALVMTTTAIDVDEELLNRCIVLTVDEEPGHTRQIQRVQRERETLAGLRARHEREVICRLHQNAQRLLEPWLVVNPFAPSLTFPDERTRARRDQAKYLTLIRAIALLHQHQRVRNTAQMGDADVTYIQVVPRDIALANRLAPAVLGHPLSDLPPHTRRLLLKLDDMVMAECARTGVAPQAVRFTRRQVRERIAGGDTQLKVHLRRLVDAEYLVVHRAGQTFSYELTWSGAQLGAAWAAALTDPTTLRVGRRAGRNPLLVGPRSAQPPPGKNGRNGASLPHEERAAVGQSPIEKAPTVDEASYPTAAAARP